MTDAKLIKWIAIIGGSLWVTIGAPSILYIAIGLFDLSTEYHANAAASIEWRNDMGDRIKRIELWQDRSRK